MLLALPPRHRLARRKRIALSELADEQWMLGTTTACPDAGRFIHACHTAGFEPQIAFHNDDYTAILGFVSAGVGVAPIPEMVARSAPRNVHVASFGPGKLTRPIVAALPAGYRPRAAAAMIEILQDVSKRWARGSELVAA